MQNNNKPLITDDASHQINSKPKFLETSPNPFVTFRMGNYPIPKISNKEILIHRINKTPSINNFKLSVEEELTKPPRMPESFFMLETTSQQGKIMTTEKNESLHATEPTVRTNVDAMNQYSSTTNNITFKDKITHPEDWKVFSALPRKYRRPVAVLLFLLLILMIIALLKPSKHSVQSYEKNQQFYPEQYTSSEKNEALGSINDFLTAENLQPIEQQNSNNIEPLPMPEDMLPMTAPITSTQMSSELQPMKNEVLNPSAVETQTQPTSSDVKTNHQVTPTVAEQTSNKSSKSIKELPQQDVFGAIEKAKLLKSSATVNDVDANISFKMRKGMTLMQGFREHNLNIADVIAMTKVKNHGKVLDKLNSGDVIRIKTNHNNRVIQLTLPNGSRFIRNENGSYQFVH